jgi:DNA-binding NarL/FixJ family response regulator
MQMALVSETEIFTESERLEIVNELSLPPRQAGVIRNLFLGHSDKQIARELKISVPTVRTHLSRLFSRFDVQDRVELVLFVVRYFCKNSGTNSCHRFR